MARRTKNTLAKLVADMVDKDREDTVFVGFVESVMDLVHQEICALVPWALWLTDEASLNATASGTQYIVAPSDMDFDSMISLRDETTNKKVRKISRQEADLIDPGRDLTGDEILWWPQRVETGANTWEDRIYFLYRPDSVDTIKAIFGASPDSPTTSQYYQLPAKYEPVLIDGTLIKVWERIDEDHDNSKAEKRYESGKQTIKRDANSGNEESVMASHRPETQSGTQGPSWPSNFDIR